MHFRQNSRNHNLQFSQSEMHKQEGNPHEEHISSPANFQFTTQIILCNLVFFRHDHNEISLDQGDCSLSLPQVTHRKKCTTTECHMNGC